MLQIKICLKKNELIKVIKARTHNIHFSKVWQDIVTSATVRHKLKALIISDLLKK